MASIETFESTLKEVVKGKRLSASKMNTLTEIALKIMENDTQMVSILYRTHKALPAKSKVASLYAFDALCRAARHQAVKQGLSAASASGPGNSFTFLAKVEGVLDGLIQDMTSCDVPEAKEKTKKILDIWAKSSTFPADVMNRLTELMKRGGEGAEKETKQPSASTGSSDPRIQPPTPTIASPPPAVPTPTAAPTAESAQATLIALLTSAAAAKSASINGQTTVNSSIPTAQKPSKPHVGPIQLSVLQKLAGKPSVVSLPQNKQHSPPPPAPVPTPAPVPAALLAFQSQSSAAAPPPVRVPEQNHAGPSSSPSKSPTEPYQPPSDRRDPRYGRYEPRGRGRGDYHHINDRRANYGDSLRGDGPSHGRGPYDDPRRGGGRYGYNDRAGSRDNNREERGAPTYDNRRMQSRSRSPPRGGRVSASSNRNIKPYSPPPHPSTTHQPRDAHNGNFRRAPPATNVGKDEFGRDIRPESPEQDLSIHKDGRIASPLSTLQPVTSISQSSLEVQQQPSPVVSPEIRSSTQPVAAGPNPTGSAGLAQSWGLDSFDLSNFNPMDPTSWQALGDAFQVTNGYKPSQEELMNFVMGAYQSQAPGFDQAGGQNWDTPPSNDRGGFQGGRGRGRGGPPGGKGGFETDAGAWGGYSGMEYGNDAAIGQYSETASFNAGPQTSGTTKIPANALGVGTLDEGEAMDMDSSESGATPDVGSGGRMQKIGDRWVFVKGGGDS